MARIAQVKLASAEPPNGVPEKAARLVYMLAWGFARIFSVLVLAIAWEMLARSGTFTPFQLPALSAVLERIWSDAISGDLWINTALTLYRALVAFAICAVGGVLIGMAMSRNVFAHWFFDPDHIGRLSDAKDRLSAGGDSLARRLRRFQNHHHRRRRYLSR